jgi:hypothetical protein
MRVLVKSLAIGQKGLEMATKTVIVEPRQKQPPNRESFSAEIIDVQSKLYTEVRVAFRKILAYEHDGMTIEAEAARQDCRKAAQKLRRLLDSHPTVGPDVADGMIAWAVHYARKDFTKDLLYRAVDSDEWRPASR